MRSFIKSPADLNGLTFPAYRKLLVKDLDRLKKEKEPVPFFLLTKYEHPKSSKEEEDDAPGSKKALLVISDFTPAWVKLIKTNLAKRKQKDYFFGTCQFIQNQEHLSFVIKKKTGSLSEAEKMLTKLFQNNLPFSFNEKLVEGDELDIKIAPEEEGGSVEELEVVETKTFENFLAAVKKLQKFKPEDGTEARQAILEAIIKLAATWFDENPNAGLDTEKTAKERTLVMKTIDGLAPHFSASKEEAELSAAKRRKDMMEKVRGCTLEEGRQLAQQKEFKALMEAELPLEELFSVVDKWGLDPLPIVEEVVPEIEKATPEEETFFGPYYDELVEDTEAFFVAPVVEPGFEKYVTIPVNVAFTTEELRGYYKYRAKGVVKVTKEKTTKGHVFYEFDDRGKKYEINKELTLGEAQWQVVDTDIFPPDPSPGHIKQGMLGDCYMLAALSTLARLGPDAIKDMIADKGSYAVVRLFLVKEGDNGMPTFKPKFIKVKKTVVKTSSGADLFAKESLWVSLIEKAWAIGKFRGQRSSTTLAQSSDFYDNDIESIAGGESDFAYEVLTGKPAEKWTYYGDKWTSTKSLMSLAPIGVEKKGGKKKGTEGCAMTPWGEEELKYYEDGKHEKMISYTLLNKNLALLAKWMKYNEGTSPIEELFLREYGDGLGEVTVEDFVNIFGGKLIDRQGKKTSCKKLDDKIAKPILNWIRSNKIYPEARDSGAYSSLQLSMFQEIKTALDNGKMVSLGTKNKFAEKPTAGSMSASESVVKGIVSGHAYSAFDTKEENGQYFILVRNPWGMVVQRKVKARDRYKEINKELQEVAVKLNEAKAALGKLPKNELTKQLVKLMGSKTVPLEKLRPAINSVGEALDNENKKTVKDPVKITFFKSLFDILDTIAVQVSARAKLQANQNEIGLGDRISNTWLTVEAPCDPNLPKGEFWLPLHKLTRYFNTFYTN